MKKLKFIFFNDYQFYDYNSHIHIDFIAEMQNSYSIMEFGLPSGKFKIFNEKKNIKNFDKIYRLYRPDFFLTYNSNGSKKGKRNCDRYRWLKEIYGRYDIPKFHITTDHCRDGYDKEQINWFREYNITCAFFRHKNFVEEDIGIPCFWLPFSVKREEYLKNSVPFQDKKSIISFAGNYEHKVYEPRRKAIRYLKNKKSIVMPKTKLITDSYYHFLSSHKASLTCGSNAGFFVAKYLEILASGSLLICNKTPGLEIIPSKYYLLYDHKNMDDFYSRYLKTINDKSLNKRIKEAQNFALVKHCHKKRISQFGKVIKSFL